MRVELREYTDEDLWLTQKLELDPVIMKEIGGASTRQQTRIDHRRRVRSVATRAAWYFTIHCEDEPNAVGTIGIWESEVDGAEVNEIGWMILPEFQRRGFATTAARQLLDRARFEQRWRIVHAYPSVTNVPSNAICRRLGFSLARTVVLAYPGHTQNANDWSIELFPPLSPGAI